MASSIYRMLMLFLSAELSLSFAVIILVYAGLGCLSGRLWIVQHPKLGEINITVVYILLQHSKTIAILL